MQPVVQIDVDEASGIWRTDGLPMVYVPRHFMVNMHNEIEQTLGRPAYVALLERSGAKSARFWCQNQADQLDLSAPEIVEHYLKRLSERGWGTIFDHRDEPCKTDCADHLARLDLCSRGAGGNPQSQSAICSKAF